MSAKVFDPAILDDLKQLDPQIVKDVIDLFFQQFPAELALLQELAKKKDVAALGKKGHLLKSSAKQVGGMRLAEICYLLEKEAASSETDARVQSLSAEFESLRKELVVYGNAAK